MQRCALFGTLALLLTTGCGIKMLKPLVAGFQDAKQQECVEAALRGDPASEALAGAFERFTRGCDAEDPAACSALGVMYEIGLQTDADPKRAFDLYDQACKDGNDSGCVNLGLAYANGIGTDLNAANAAALFELGCKGGNDRGCTELATLHSEGAGVNKNARMAAELFDASCKRGHAESCFRLATMFDDGTLGPDPARTLALYEMACAFGKKAGCKRTDQLYAQMRSSRPRHPDERHPGVAAAR